MLIVMIGLVAAAAWFAYDRITLFAQSESRPGVIVSCKSKTVVRKVRNRAGQRRRWSYAPFAVSETGDNVIGSVFLSERAWCERQIGRKTTILVNVQDPADSRINSFVQLWLFPTVLGFVFVFIALARRPKAAATATAGVIFCAGGLAAMEFGYLDGIAGSSVVPPERRSEIALTQCIEQAMAKQGVSYHGDLKRLNCNNRGITDVAELSRYTGLEELYLSSNDLATIEPLRSLVKLRKLSLHKNKRLTSLRDLERMTALQELQARRMQINDIEALRGLEELHIIDLSRNQITNVSALTGLERLEQVFLNYNPITDIAPFAAKPSLRQLTFYGSNVRDITPLYGNDQLKIVGVRGKGPVDCDQISELRRRLARDAKVAGQKSCD